MDNGDHIKKKVLSSLAWSFLERCGAQGVGLLVNIILARLLLPEDHGTLAIMMIFVNLANQLVQNGFSTSLIQNRDVTDEDYSSVLYISLILSTLLYGVIYFCAPIIAVYYKALSLTEPFRVLALLLFPSALQSVQTARLRREMDFKQLFHLTVLSSMVGGAAGVAMAFGGLGVWALVVQQLCASVCTCIVLWLKLRWKPQTVMNWRRVGILFSYGWKLLAASILNTLYNDLAGLIIGKKYTTTTLAYYDKGQMIPQKLMTNVSDSMRSVMLSALAKEQNDRMRCKAMLRRSLQVSSFIIFPMMAGLAAVARPVVEILLTEKWLPCVPFMQLTCIIYAANTIASANLQAMNALGRSDMFLKLEIIKKIVGLSVLAVTVFYFHSAIAIMWGTVATIPFGLFVNAFPNKKIVGYSFTEQMRDIFPPLLLSVLMFCVVSVIGRAGLSIWGTLVIQILTGVVFYAGVSALLKLESFSYTLGIIKPYISGLLLKLSK